MKAFIFLGLLWANSILAAPTSEPSPQPRTPQQLAEDLRNTIEKRKFRWDGSLLHTRDLQFQHRTVLGYPLVYYTCGDPQSKNRSLVLSAVHGDEVTPLYFGFRFLEWLRANPELCRGKFIVVAPVVNPDGFMRYSRGTRTNWNKVDLNRNFDTPEWDDRAHALWKSKFKSQRRYYPGDKPASEPETQFQKWLIENFQPTKIMTVHAPLNILDYDGPANDDIQAFSKAYINSCESLKKAVSAATTLLKFYAYGTFPGSLGNFAGQKMGIPTFTVELPTAKPEEAGFYFGDMEKGSRLFLDYELKELRAKGL